MSDGTKTCVACAEEIKAGAALCRFCRTRQDDPSFARPVPEEQAEAGDVKIDVLLGIAGDGGHVMKPLGLNAHGVVLSKYAKCLCHNLQGF